MSELQVILPAELEPFFEESGFAAPTHHERRQYARLKVRQRVKIEFLGVDDGPSERTDPSGWALTKDMSKNGVGILYHEQVFPEESFRIVLAGRRITALVVRCRRIGDSCYEVGAVISKVENLD
jgi:hypothetical protein